ncbi:MAG: OmpA family protein [Chlorobi bacterium]|nr:OmpA family protein [Chlorobiota bacterium]
MPTRQIVLLVFIIAPVAIAQTMAPFQRELLGVSLRGIYAALQHSPNFSALPGTVDCGTYTQGRGSAVGAALTAEYPITPSFHLGLGALYINRGGTLNTPNDVEPAFDSTTSSIVDVVSENTLEVHAEYVELAPTVWWTPLTLGRSTVRLDAAVRFGIPLRVQMQQLRRIVSPENAVFISNQQRVINWTNGFQPLSDLSRPTLGISVGAEHMLPIGSRLHLLQRIGYDYMLSSPVRSVRWTISGFRFELGVRLSFDRAMEPPQQPTPPSPPVLADTPVIQQPTPLPIPSLAVHIEGFDGYIEEGNELIATLPLVNAVFFEQNSAQIPSRYARRQADSVATNDPVVAHRNILLVVAAILRRNPNANVILDGATAGEFETGDTALARRRAEAVADALVQLGVPRERVRTRWSRLPRVASNMDYSEGRAENQRVDITLVNAPILEYVAKRTFSRLKGATRIHLSGSNLAGAEIQISGTGIEQRTVGDTGTIDLPLSLRLDTDNHSMEIIVQAALSDNTVVTRDTAELDLRLLPRRRVELSTTNFEAILRFDYNSSQLSAENRELLRQLVERIPPDAMIEIGGSADVLGDIARNRRLAEDRAHITEEYLRTLSGKNTLRIVARGIERRFDDSTPEGRFLNRSIRITIR